MAVNLFQPDFQQLKNRIGASVDVGQCGQLCEGGLPIRRQFYDDIVQLDFNFLQIRTGGGDDFDQLLSPVDRTGASTGYINANDRIGGKKARELIRTRQLYEGVFVWLERCRRRHLREQLPDDRFVAREQYAERPEAERRQGNDHENAENSPQNTTFPTIR